MDRSYYNPTPAQRREIQEAQALHRAKLTQRRAERAAFEANALIERAGRAPVVRSGLVVL